MRRANPTGLLRETASRLIRRGVGEPAPTDDERARASAASCSSRRRKPCRRASRAFRTPATSFETIDRMKAMVDEGKLGVRLWVMVRAGIEQRGAEARAVPDGRLRQRPPDRPRHQAIDRRRARLARRVAARAVRRQARQHRPEHDAGRRRFAKTRELAHAARISALRPRDRRPRQPRDAEHLRGGVQGESRQEGSPLARRARAASPSRPTSRGSARSASLPRCRACTARRTRPMCSRGSGPSAPKRAPMSGRS